MHSSSARAQHFLSGAGNLKAVYQYAQRIADGFRQPLPESWPAPLRSLISDCWAQRSSERPAFAQVLERLRAIQVGAWQSSESLILRTGAGEAVCHPGGCASPRAA